jgi:hypothetical protein
MAANRRSDPGDIKRPLGFQIGSDLVLPSAPRVTGPRDAHHSDQIEPGLKLNRGDG